VSLEQGAADLLRALGAYAWPAAAVIIAAVLRREIGAFLTRLAQRARSAEVEGAGVKAKIDFTEIQTEAQAKTPTPSALIQRLRELLQNPPK
jgi:hypothetical protein